MNIREATENDAKVLSDVSVKSYVDAFGSPYSDPLEMKKWIDETRSEAYYKKIIDKNLILVAEENGHIVGYLEFGAVGANYPVKNKEEGDWQISRLYVLSEYQNKGIGKSLLDKILSYPELHRAKSIYVDVSEKNKGAQRLYKSYGFKETGVVTDGDMYMVRRNSGD
jgi:ribosomal protein S18 acetylase RimI-like enzyme